jgi:hypothetical protein
MDRIAVAALFIVMAVIVGAYALAQRELLKHVHTDEYLASRVSLLRQLQTWKANGRALA